MRHDVRKFALTDMVTWDASGNPSQLPDMVGRYGEGPFRVVGLGLLTLIPMDGSTYPVSVTIEIPGGSKTSLNGEWFKKVDN